MFNSAASRSLGQDGPSNWIKLDGHSFQWLVDQDSYPAHWWFQYVSNITISFHIFLAVVPSSGRVRSTGRLQNPRLQRTRHPPPGGHEPMARRRHLARSGTRGTKLRGADLGQCPGKRFSSFEDLNQLNQLYFNYILQGISTMGENKPTKNSTSWFLGPT